MTGGARGIGYEVVRLMVGLGAHVIIGTLSSHAPGQAGNGDLQTLLLGLKVVLLNMI